MNYGASILMIYKISDFDCCNYEKLDLQQSKARILQVIHNGSIAKFILGLLKYNFSYSNRNH
jgi:hypothetical protein